MGSQHLSPNVNFEPQIWPETITSRDAESTCFKGSRTSCDVINFVTFWPNFAGKDTFWPIFCRKRTSRDGCFLPIKLRARHSQCDEQLIAYGSCDSGRQMGCPISTVEKGHDHHPNYHIVFLNSVHTGCIVKTSGFTRGVWKNSGILLKVFLWNS